MVKTVAAATQPSISITQFNKLKEQVGKIQELEDMLNKLLRDMKGLNLGELKDRLDELYRLLAQKADKKDVEMLDS